MAGAPLLLAALEVLNTIHFTWKSWWVGKKEEGGRNERPATQHGRRTSFPRPTTSGELAKWNQHLSSGSGFTASVKRTGQRCLIWIINFYYLSWKSLHSVAFYCHFSKCTFLFFSWTRPRQIRGHGKRKWKAARYKHAEVNSRKIPAYTQMNLKRSFHHIRFHLALTMHVCAVTVHTAEWKRSSYVTSSCLP